MQSPDERTTKLMDSAVNLMFEIYRVRGDCSRTARQLGSGVAGEAALEDCARLDDTLAKVYRHLQHTLKDIRRARARRVKRKS